MVFQDNTVLAQV